MTRVDIDWTKGREPGSANPALDVVLCGDMLDTADWQSWRDTTATVQGYAYVEDVTHIDNRTTRITLSPGITGTQIAAFQAGIHQRYRLAGVERCVDSIDFSKAVINFIKPDVPKELHPYVASIQKRLADGEMTYKAAYEALLRHTL